MQDDVLRQRLPYLQSRVGLSADGLNRLLRLADSGLVEAWHFRDIYIGSVDHAEAEELVQLLEAISKLDNGVGVTLETLYFWLAFTKDKGPPPRALVEYGRRLMAAGQFGHEGPSRDHHLGSIVELCFNGTESEGAARQLCQRFRAAVKAYKIYAFDSHFLILAMFKVQPNVTLDCLVDPEDGELDHDMFDAHVNQQSPVATVNVPTLVDWANIAPDRRYPNLGRAIPIFELENLGEVTGLSKHFIALLRNAPNKASFLGDVYSRIHPDGWSGPLSAVLEQRRTKLAELADLGDKEIDAWLAVANTFIDNWIMRERCKESGQEESFE